MSCGKFNNIPLGRIFTQDDIYKDICEIFNSMENQDEFISFLRFCAERLKKGAQVQEVWRDYQERDSQ